MWRAKISKLLALTLFPLALWAEENPLYKLKLFVSFKETAASLKRYDNTTKQFLAVVAENLKEELLQWLQREKVELFLSQGIGSDYTLTLTFPQAYIYKISQKIEKGTAKYYLYGYRIDLTLAVYIFTSSDHPSLVLYRTYSFKRYHPPSGEYLPLNLSFAEAVAKVLFLNLKRDLKPFIEQQQKKLKYYQNLGR